MPPPATVDVHAHALSPRLVELTASHREAPNPHNEHGYLPSYIPRSDHGYEVRPEARAIPHPPSSYLRRVTVDALVYRPENVAHLVRTLGASRVVLGTDYPFDMGEERPLEVLSAVDGLSDEDRERIKSRNALQLLGMAGD